MLNLSNSNVKRTIPIIVIILLLDLVSLIIAKGVSRDVAFNIVFIPFQLLALALLKARMTKLYGDDRSIKLLVYGLGAIVLLTPVFYILQYFAHTISYLI